MIRYLLDVLHYWISSSCVFCYKICLIHWKNSCCCKKNHSKNIHWHSWKKFRMGLRFRIELLWLLFSFRKVLRRRVLTHCLWLIRLHIRQHSIKIFIVETFFFIFVCAYVLSSFVHRYRYIRRIDLVNLKVYIMFCLYLYLYMCPV